VYDDIRAEGLDPNNPNDLRRYNAGQQIDTGVANSIAAQGGAAGAREKLRQEVLARNPDIAALKRRNDARANALRAGSSPTVRDTADMNDQMRVVDAINAGGPAAGRIESTYTPFASPGGVGINMTGQSRPMYVPPVQPRPVTLNVEGNPVGTPISMEARSSATEAAGLYSEDKASGRTPEERAASDTTHAGRQAYIARQNATKARGEMARSIPDLTSGDPKRFAAAASRIALSRGLDPIAAVQPSVDAAGRGFASAPEMVRTDEERKIRQAREDAANATALGIARGQGAEAAKVRSEADIAVAAEQAKANAALAEERRGKLNAEVRHLNALSERLEKPEGGQIPQAQDVRGQLGKLADQFGYAATDADRENVLKAVRRIAPWATGLGLGHLLAIFGDEFVPKEQPTAGQVGAPTPVSVTPAPPTPTAPTPVTPVLPAPTAKQPQRTVEQTVQAGTAKFVKNTGDVLVRNPIAAATGVWRGLTGQPMGGQPQATPTAKPPIPEMSVESAQPAPIPPQAIEYLRTHPETREAFDRHYGAGQAAAILGQ
jgi:hypothetical protein